MRAPAAGRPTALPMRPPAAAPPSVPIPAAFSRVDNGPPAQPAPTRAVKTAMKTVLFSNLLVLSIFLSPPFCLTAVLRNQPHQFPPRKRLLQKTNPISLFFLFQLEPKTIQVCAHVDGPYSGIMRSYMCHHLQAVLLRH